MEIQFATIIRGGNDKPQVVVRIHNPGEVDAAAAILSEAASKLPSLMQTLVEAVEKAPAGAVQLLQQELGAQVIGEQAAPTAPVQQAIPGPLGVGWTQPGDVQQAAVQAGVPQGPQAPASAFNPGGHYQVPQPQNAFQAMQGQQAPAPQWAGQQVPQQPQAPAQQGQEVTLPPGPCPFCGKNHACPDCGSQTTLGTIKARTGKVLNKHKCPTYGHKGVMCSSPIWKSKQAAAMPLFGGQLPAGLVYEQ